MSDIWTDFKALVNNAPKTGAYNGPSSLWNDATADSATQYIIIQENGIGGSDEDVQATSFDVWMVGAVNDSANIKTIYDDAQSIYRYLLKNFKQGCIIGVEDGVSPDSPKYGTDGRVWTRFSYGRILYSVSE
jgi:hypothetical protein